MQRRPLRLLGGAALLSAALLACGGDDPADPGDQENPELAAQISVLSGGDQTALPGTALPEPIEVEVRDAIRRRLGNREVVFEPMPGNGTVSVDTILANTLGRASTVWTLGPSEGQQVLLVKADTVTIQVTATAGEGAPAVRR